MPTAWRQAVVGPLLDLQQVGFPSLLENPWPPEMKIEIPGVGKALWIVRESSVEAREGRPLAPSPDESSVEELLQVRVRGGKRGLLIRRD